MRKWATGLLLALWMAVIFIFSHQVAEESARSVVMRFLDIQ